MPSKIIADESNVTVSVVDARVDVNVCENVAVVETGASGPQGPRGTQVLSGNIPPSINIGLIGDQYIDTTSGKLYGPKTTSGWGEGVYIGISDPSHLGQVYPQTTPSTTWNIVHTLNFIPNIVIVDTEGNVVEGDYEYIGDNIIVATFSQPIMGSAYLS